jgi:hypothetical protein
VVSVPNVNREQPIQRVAGTSCDRKKESIFPSVYGEQGNVVLLSQSFDDTAMLGQFQPPQGTQLMGWTNELDEVITSQLIESPNKEVYSLHDHLVALGWICLWEETRQVRLNWTNADARNWRASVQGCITFSDCEH